MKWIRLTPQAEAAFEEIEEYSVKTWGETTATAYRRRLVDRLKKLASGQAPSGRPCALLFGSKATARAFADLRYCREGSHYLFFRETTDTLLMVDVLHVSMDVERHLRGHGAGEWNDEGGV